jgi:mannose-6-phosphate isomerase-like protein (cupin superfamily)
LTAHCTIQTRKKVERTDGIAILRHRCRRSYPGLPGSSDFCLPPSRKNRYSLARPSSGKETPVPPIPVNLEEKLTKIQEHWNPHIVGELNGQHVKLAKVKGEFVWHHHQNEDELFLVLKGVLRLELREGTVPLGPGEFFIVPRGVEHRPVAEEEVHLLMFEPASTLNTGNVRNERTVDELRRI